jgi:hypothetical protein
MFNFSLKNKDITVYTNDELLKEVNNSILKGNYDLNYIKVIVLKILHILFLFLNGMFQMLKNLINYFLKLKLEI